MVGVAGAATVGLEPRLRINETNQVSERRVYFLVFYIFGLEKNPAIIRRLHSSHCSSHIEKPVVSSQNPVAICQFEKSLIRQIVKVAEVV